MKSLPKPGTLVTATNRSGGVFLNFWKEYDHGARYSREQVTLKPGEYALFLGFKNDFLWFLHQNKVLWVSTRVELFTPTDEHTPEKKFAKFFKIGLD